MNYNLEILFQKKNKQKNKPVEIWDLNLEPKDNKYLIIINAMSWEFL